mmetsp:Transcript_45221/g.103768  ORF Transcript_45221/g.103768 Transcript_45221/m.103768 type:complete len:299 (+) Transcript_45221:975-1871(+)
MLKIDLVRDHDHWDAASGRTNQGELRDFRSGDEIARRDQAEAMGLSDAEVLLACEQRATVPYGGHDRRPVEPAVRLALVAECFLVLHATRGAWVARSALPAVGLAEGLMHALRPRVLRGAHLEGTHGARQRAAEARHVRHADELFPDAVARAADEQLGDMPREEEQWPRRPRDEGRRGRLQQPRRPRDDRGADDHAAGVKLERVVVEQEEEVARRLGGRSPPVGPPAPREAALYGGERQQLGRHRRGTVRVALTLHQLPPLACSVAQQGVVQHNLPQVARRRQLVRLAQHAEVRAHDD